MRIEFTKKTRILAFQRADGRCEICGVKLYAGNVDFDHRIPAELGGDATLENCQALCRTHHKLKTKTDHKNIGRARRVHAKHIGIKRPRSITAWRKFDGTPVRASRERT